MTMGLRNLKKIKHNGKTLEEILKAHEFFWANKEGGARADLAETQASGVEFFRCDLTNADFQKAMLRNVNFRDAHLDGAKFAGADMGIAILRETDLQNVDLLGVDLSTTLMPPGWGAKKQGA